MRAELSVSEAPRVPVVISCVHTLKRGTDELEWEGYGVLATAILAHSRSGLGHGVCWDGTAEG